MKKNYYKAMAAAIAMGLAVTPSVSYAAGNVTVQALLDNGTEDLDEADEDWNEDGEGFDEDWNEDGEGFDEDWNEDEVGSGENRDAEDDGDWNGDEEGSDEDWDDGEGSAEDWDNEDDGDWDEDGEGSAEDWDDEDEEDWDDGEGFAEDWDDENEEDWDEEDWGDEGNWIGTDNAEDWEYDEAVAEPEDPMYMADDADTMEEAVPADRVPYVKKTDEVNQNGAGENGEAPKPVKTSEAIVGEVPSRQVEYADAKDSRLAGKYQTEVEARVFSGAGEEKAVLAKIKKDIKAYCYGYYTEKNGEKWLYVQYFQDGNVHTGFCKGSQLKKG